MKAIYLYCNMTKQAHHQAMERQVREEEKSMVYVGLMIEARQIHPGMGIRAMYEMLQPEGIGRDAFIALGLQEGLRIKAVDNYVRTTYSVKSNRFRNLLVGKEFTDVNQIWSSDLTYLYCLGRFYYLFIIMDVYSRRIVGYSIADNMRSENALEALKMALALRGKSHYMYKLIHHSDRGSQYASDIYTETLYNYGIQISMCNEVYENTHIERVNDTIKNQYLNRKTISENQMLINEVYSTMHAYNYQRPHLSLDKMTPVSYESQLPTVPVENRTVLRIFTSEQTQKNQNSNQLNLFAN
jgi:putative transposase